MSPKSRTSLSHNDVHEVKEFASTVTESRQSVPWKTCNPLSRQQILVEALGKKVVCWRWSIDAVQDEVEKLTRSFSVNPILRLDRDRLDPLCSNLTTGLRDLQDQLDRLWIEYHALLGKIVD